MKRLGALFVILLLPALAAAQTRGFRLGPLELHPRLKLAGTYDSNIYMVPSDLNGVQNGGGVRQALIFDHTAGIDFKLPISGIHAVDGGYEFAMLHYSTMSKANDMINQTAKLNYSYRGPMGLSAKLGDSFLSTMDPAFSESAARERRWQNTANLSAEYALGASPLFVGLSGLQTTHKYLSATIGPLLNRYEQEFGGRIGYRVQPKTRVYLAYRRGITHYTVHQDSPKNSKSHSAALGVEGVLSPKLTGKVEGGMGMRRYDDDGAVKSSSTFARVWNVSAQVNWKPEDRWDVGLRASRSLQEATFTGNRYYVSNLLGLTYVHELPTRLKISLDVSFTSDRYPYAATVSGKTANRRDDIYQSTLSLDYPLRDWLSVFGSYVHRQKFSTFSGQFNYDDHQVSTGLKLTL